MRFVCGLILLSVNSFAAGPLIFGGRGGAAIADDTNTIAGVASGSGLNRSYLVGPTVGVRLPVGFSVEADALYNRQNLNFARIGSFSAGTHSDSWEFPVMLKFAPRLGMIAPVVGGGVSFRHISNLGYVPNQFLDGIYNTNSAGFVVGGGFQFHAGPATITPEVRYTRWQSGSLLQTFVDDFLPGRNAVQVLIGVTF